MGKPIERVAVLGAGTMGAGIAALCASAGQRVLLLDMPAKDGPRNALTQGAKDRMLSGKPAMLDDPAKAANIEVGNFEDDLARLKDVDLIVEAIIEEVGAKRALFQKVEAIRRDGSLVATNTSGIMLKAITEGMPARFRQDFAVTHFFNPVKVMKLVELVPGADTRPATTEALAAYLGGPLAKGVVLAKDTVNFIANRIGCFWLLAGLNETEAAFKAGVGLEELDATMSAPVGVPATGLFGLVDLVGLDVLGLVAENLKQNLPAADRGRAYCQLPPAVAAMRARGQVGRKSGGGFYRMQTGADGQRLKQTFDPLTGAWRASATALLPAEQQTLAGLLLGGDTRSRFAWAAMGQTLLYSAELVPEISDDIVNIDRAMRWGFAWKQGPFEMLDAIGPARVIGKLKAAGDKAPAMLEVLERAGAASFYRDGGREFLGRDGAYRKVT